MEMGPVFMVAVYIQGIMKHYLLPQQKDDVTFFLFLTFKYLCSRHSSLMTLGNVYV